MVETLTKEGLNRWLEKGISNVAFVSLALGLENAASNAFIQEKVIPFQYTDTCAKDWPSYPAGFVGPN